MITVLVFECNRQTFVKALEPFVNWLEEAEEEEWVQHAAIYLASLSTIHYCDTKNFHIIWCVFDDMMTMMMMMFKP